MFFFFNGFRNIFAASIVFANLKRISCSLTELRLLLCRFLSSKHCETANYIQQYEFLNVSVYFLRDTFLRVKGYSISLIESPRRVVLFPNLFYVLTNISVELLLNNGVKSKDCLKLDQFAGKIIIFASYYYAPWTWPCIYCVYMTRERYVLLKAVLHSRLAV